ncbi:hypothetical protein HDU96_006767 [Phlyctochytrium bullatum]|nr:hypothetical protein HDU96_006767 [Phlyctochytrium bullatum]
MLSVVKLVALLPALAAVALAQNSQQCVTNYDPNTDYFPEKVDASKLGPNSSLTFTYNKHYKVITNAIDQETIVLYQCGTPVPTVPGANRTIAVPVSSASISDTTSVYYLTLLDKITSVNYTSGGAQFITDACVQALNVTDTDATTPAVASREINSTSVFFQYFSTLPTNNSVSFPATQETSALKRVDWLSFIGAFYNLEGKANKLTTDIRDNYGCVSRAAKTSAGQSGPKVAVINYLEPSSFNNNTAQYELLNYGYWSSLINDAGATVAVGPSTSSAAVTNALGQKWVFTKSEDIVAAIKDADVILDNTYNANTLAEFTANLKVTPADVKALRNKQIYGPNKKVNRVGGTAFYEEAVVMNNLVLADIASILYPTLIPNYSRRYFKSFDNEPEETLQASSCPNFRAALSTVSAATVTCPTAVLPATVAVTTSVPTTATAAPATTTSSKSGAVQVVAGVASAAVAAAVALIMA